ncbi:restriction endonuclease [Streptomyces malaysiensis]|uniref:Restriction endonuclease n=1 Tax=Streptomyces malaysiensis subsp. samsunensis TaxID=459658 RepID=A0A9X2M3Y3_STRMQ|nr:restriction endonuclease [Streptomyces samsunensis]MCQ8834993.1 restriction endonuclease [Streptomyces samsunensis]
MDIAPGEKRKRTAIQDLYGGNRQAGIAHSRQSPNVLLFSNPGRGHQVGYFDGWGADGYYHYTGEGQKGDQEMTRGNLAILRHVQEGRALHLFDSVARGVVAYMGEFTLATDTPWYYQDAPDAQDEIRSVIMFRLKPVGTVAKLGENLAFTPRSEDVVEDVAVEKHQTERMLVSSKTQEREAERREAPLVTAYRDYLLQRGHTVTRKKIIPAGEVRPLYTDLFDTTDHVLIEAKGSVAREAVRMAIGQLYDYRRYITPAPSLAVLLPSRPRRDLIDLCNVSGARVAWPEGRAFKLE